MRKGRGNSEFGIRNSELLCSEGSAVPGMFVLLAGFAVAAGFAVLAWFAVAVGNSEFGIRNSELPDPV